MEPSVQVFIDLTIEAHSKAQALRIAEVVGGNADNFSMLMAAYVEGDALIQQRASYSILTTIQYWPYLVQPHWDALVHQLTKPKIHDAIKRVTLKLLAEYDFPEHLDGKVATLAFDFLADPNEPIAAKVFSITVLAKIAKKEPELIPELRLLIEEQMPLGSAGFRSRGAKVLKQLDSIS